MTAKYHKTKVLTKRNKTLLSLFFTVLNLSISRATAEFIHDIWRQLLEQPIGRFAVMIFRVFVASTIATGAAGHRWFNDFMFA